MKQSLQRIEGRFNTKLGCHGLNLQETAGMTPLLWVPNSLLPEGVLTQSAVRAKM